jgi:hypothetical protein
MQGSFDCAEDDMETYDFSFIKYNKVELTDFS